MINSRPTVTPFWRRGNEGVARPAGGSIRKRDGRPDPHTGDVFFKAYVSPAIKLACIKEAARLNVSISRFIRELITKSLDTVERERRRAAGEPALKHQPVTPDLAENLVLVRSYISPKLKRKLIAETVEKGLSMSAYVRRVLRDYFFAQELRKHNDTWNTPSTD